MHELEIKVLSALGKSKATLEQLESSLNVGRDQIMWAVENLSAQNALSVEKETSKGVVLTSEGRQDLDGFPEEKLAGKLKEKKKSVAEIKDQVALSWAKKNEWITIEKGVAALTEKGSAVAGGSSYRTREILNKLNKAQPSEVDKITKQNKEIVDSLLRRGLVEIKERSIVKSISITDRGLQLLKDAPKETGIGVLTRDVIAGRLWEKQGFKSYNISSPVEEIYPGRMHPIREFINVVRNKWLEMGFVEVAGPIIESAFWNFDALFSPQDHPTREMHDTFFLKNPAELTIEDIEALGRVKKMHKTGWKEKWSEEIAKGAVLRTHTTSVSARYMRKLAAAVDENFPLKLFSVGSVFRNENLDYKHLAELHQYDGIIVGDGLTLANLIDTLKKFYGKLGFDSVQIRPSYFPFTEPSLEVFYYDEEHGDSIELTGGGIIRKEITKALGINKTVLAWGGGIERLMLNSRVLGLDSVTTPYKNNIGWLRSRKRLKV